MAECRGVTALALVLLAPTTAVTGTDVEVKVRLAHPGAVVRFEQRHEGEWHPLGRDRAGQRGKASVRFKLTRHGSYLVRAVDPRRGRSRLARIRSRYLTLAAVGDINLGDGPGAYMSRYGYRYPWRRVAPTLRAADIAFGNLECAVSRRGRPVPKQFNFRGRPAALRRVRRFAGFDVLNVANNHSGDYGRLAFLDTLRFTRGLGMTPVGGGVSRAHALQPRVVKRHGLRVAFVGFSDRLPLSFYATASRPGIAFAATPAIRRAVHRAKRRADVVVATFHWGDELHRTPNARQHLFARTALRAGADAVIGAHPHVLQPRRRLGRKIVAYSLGNFVFSTGGGATSQTGILRLRLSGRGVEGMHLLRGHIAAAQPKLR
jgi:hypothetical protein